MPVPKTVPVSARQAAAVTGQLWTPVDSPFPPPYEPVTQSFHRCHWFHDNTLNASMCLMGNDRVSNDIRRKASWIDHCTDIVQLWRKASGSSESATYVDVGGNIGHCITVMLLQTRAHVVVVEPSPANLFYLTSTVHALAKQRPDVASRVKLLPIAASNETGSNTLYVAAHNAGNSVVGATSTAVRDHDGQDMTSEQYAIYTRRLDDVVAIKRLLGAGGMVPVVKLDVQGFECRAIDGMGELLQRAKTLRVELADRWLMAHGCSSSEALLKLERLGFAVNMPPPCIVSRYGCDVVVSKQSVPVVVGNLCRWRWHATFAAFCPTTWCAACASQPLCRVKCSPSQSQQVAHQDRRGSAGCTPEPALP